MRGVLANRRRTADTPDLAAQGQSVSRKTVAEVPLTGLPLQCPGCGGDIWLIAFITEPGPIRKILTHLGEPLEPPPVSPARGPPTEWAELVPAHDERDAIQSSPDDV
jgi:hypothetical protein